ncbi:DUF2252 family protein [Bowmanella dokdonensis]|uniref:DUF2252 family protein n=1 Tax=Bowmanella dokdonensis TaxID=751969 RepID=A0A939IPP2_9ALTE|nr:DUF2252 family protein [Bowmanella dokdonensis]MBN7823757.1 DUF2252 family protein [Bowmanella dokdonensis]
MADRRQTLAGELSRVDGSLGIGKHHKMARNPFVFMRGAAQLFYADLASGELVLPPSLASVPLTTIMGDCHLSNFGFLTEEGSHGDQIIFSPNDFDDACLGLAGWDLLRFCLSLSLCSEYCQGVSQGRYQADPKYLNRPPVDERQAEKAMQAFLDAYLNMCKASVDAPECRMRAMALFEKPHLLAKQQKKAVARAAGGEEFASKSALAKAVDIDGSPLKFRDRPDKFRRPAPDRQQEIYRVFSPYMDDAILDVVERLNAGTGSVNMQRYYLLIGPPDYQGREDLPLCHIVEIKQQRQAAPLHHFPDLSPVNGLNPAHLTVICQRRMQRRPDLVLDEVEWRGAHWLIRSRHHARVGIDPERVGLGDKAVAGGFIDYAMACGQALALAHCRGDRRSVRFEVSMAEALPRVRQELLNSVTFYARQCLQDCQYLHEMLQGQP